MFYTIAVKTNPAYGLFEKSPPDGAVAAHISAIEQESTKSYDYVDLGTHPV